MLGAIIGDICGSRYEFDNNKSYGHIRLFKEGSCPTDDSVMTAAVARALMDSAGMEHPEVFTALVDSMHYYGHLFSRAGYGGRFRTWLKESLRKPYNSYGNGSAMRVSAVGWMYPTLEETLEYAEISACVTHDHPEGIKGAKAIAAAIFLARTGASKEQIRAYTEANFYKLDFTLDEIRPTYRFNETCQGSCPQAIEAFLESSSFEDAVKLAISVGGDTDTIAAMTGSIAEAFYGVPAEIAAMAFKVMQDKKQDETVCNNSVLACEVRRFWFWLEARGLQSPRPEGL